MRQTQNADAYDAYLRGRYLQNRRTADTNLQAVREYERATALDPTYALAWSALALTYSAGVINGDARPFEVWPRARDAAVRAVGANPQLAEAQLAVGHISFVLDWDWGAAEAALRQAVARDPVNAAAHLTLGHVLSQLGRHDEGEIQMRRARDLAPLDPLNHALSAQVAFQARDNAAAVEHARRATRLDSTFWIGYMALAQAFEQTGDHELAIEAVAEAARLSGNNSKAMSLHGYLLATRGRRHEAREVLACLGAAGSQRYVPAYATALVHAGLGEPDAMFASLDRAYGERDVHLIFLPVDPKWDEFRSTRRFKELLERCGFAAMRVE